MIISDEMQATIESQIATLVMTRKPGMSIEKFIGENGRILAQAELDEDALVRAGFTPNNVILFRGYLYMLTEEHGSRIIAVGDSSDSSKTFDAMMDNLLKKRTIMIAIAQFIIKRVNSSEIKRAYERIKKGTTVLAYIQDVISLSELIQLHLPIAAQIRPAGELVDEAFIQEATALSHTLYDFYSQTEITDSDRMRHVERQNKLITLCMDAEILIKEYAHAAFLFDQEYYDEHYVNRVIRDRYRQSLKEESPTNGDDQETETEVEPLLDMEG